LSKADYSTSTVYSIISNNTSNNSKKDYISRPFEWIDLKLGAYK